MKRLLTLCLLASAPLADGASIVRDLGAGLTYYRIHRLPEDQPSPPSGRPGACILDLRFAKADEIAALTLRDWIKFNVSVHAPVYVLENAATDPALLATVPGSGQPGLIVLAPIGDKIGPDIGVHVTASQDRKAYDALEKGTDVNALLRDYPDKPRIDEAYLEKEHIPDSQSPEVPTDNLPPRPLIDPLLQRAVQVHRGLVALKRV